MLTVYFEIESTDHWSRIHHSHGAFSTPHAVVTEVIKLRIDVKPEDATRVASALMSRLEDVLFCDMANRTQLYMPDMGIDLPEDEAKLEFRLISVNELAAVKCNLSRLVEHALAGFPA